MKTMKKQISLILAMVMVFTMVFCDYTVVLAAKGPNKSNTSAAWIQVTPSGASEAKVLYKNNVSKVSKVKGLSYDKKTNTLTMKNYKGKCIETNEMGDDFKIKVVGKCSLQFLLVWGYGYGGGLTITGDGTLNIKNTNTDNFQAGIMLFCEGAKSKLTINKGVTIKINVAKGYRAIDVIETRASTPIKLAKGVKLSKGKIKKYNEEYLAQYTYEAFGFSLPICEKDGVEYTYHKNNAIEDGVLVRTEIIISEMDQLGTQHDVLEWDGNEESVTATLEKAGYKQKLSGEKAYYGYVDESSVTIK